MLPYALLAATVGLLYTRSLLRLPRVTAFHLVVAGSVFVAGAIGVELFHGYVQESFRLRGVPLALSYMVEEGMETFDAAFFIYAVVRFLQERAVCNAAEAA